MTRLVLISLLAATLLACSSEKEKQVGASAFMGGALGVVGGPIGVVVGGAMGAAVGAVLPQEVFQQTAQSNDPSPQADHKTEN